MTLKFNSSLFSALLVIGLLYPGHLLLAQEKINPVIKSFGGIYAIPEAVETPSKAIDYNIVIDVRSGPSSPDQINPALNNIARMLNLHAAGGVSPDKVKVKAVIHNLATPTIADNATYQEKFGVDNPNIGLIQELTDAGVELFVCGQSMIAREYPVEGLNPNIKLSISAITVMTTYEIQGFTSLVF
jgi:intracellular sulfur oxidation DsrE/DsrF family protein